MQETNARAYLPLATSTFSIELMDGWIYLILNVVYDRRRVSFKASKEASVDKGKGK